MKRKIFLICPVRAFLLPDGRPKADELLTPEERAEKAAIEAYVANLEVGGAEVYFPARDTDQTDPHGWTICCRNRSAIMDANEIHVWYDAASTGSKFDLGMVFALLGIGWLKKVVIANPEAVKLTPRKSFENVLLKLAEETAKLCQTA